MTIGAWCTVTVSVMAIGAGGCLDSQAATAAQAATPPTASALHADTMLRAADLQADVSILRRAYETLHPGLHRYSTPAQVDAAFRLLEVEFQQDRTLAQAYLAFSVLAAKVRCGHTYPNFFNQSKAVAAALFQALRVPFYFRWLGDRMIVTRSFTADPRIRAGTEVLAINGVPVADVLARLMTVARADGNNDAKRVAYLQVEGTSRFEAFDIYWPLFFPSSTSLVILRVRGPGGTRVQTVSVPPVSYADRVASIEAAAGTAAAKDAPIWEFGLLDDQTGYLRMPSWALYNSTWNWRAFLEHWDPSFKNWGSAAIDSTDRFYRLRRDADDELGGVITPALPRFAGRLWVLVGATNSSATFEFAQTVRQNHLGTLVGQPTGGNQRGINGGAFFFLRLPHSGLELDVPLIGQFPDGDRPDAGLQPDISVVPTISDIARGRDVELDAVRTRVQRPVQRPPG